MNTMFAFVIEGVDGSEVHIAAASETEAQRMADARAKMMKLGLRRAVDRDVRVAVKVAS